MLFYNVEGTFADKDKDIGELPMARRSAARKIAYKSEKFNEKLCGDSFYFVSDSSEGVLKVGVIANDEDGVDQTLESYLRYIDCELTNIVKKEITINQIYSLLHCAVRQSFVINHNEAVEKIGLNKVMSSRGTELNFCEEIIEDCSREAIFSNSAKYPLKETLYPELKRIYAGPSDTKVCWHPVHYMLETDDSKVRIGACKILLQALYANGRLRSRRYCFVTFRPDDNLTLGNYEALYGACSGGTIIVNYLANNVSASANSASNEAGLVAKLCEVARRYRNKVLTIICLSRESEGVKTMFYENLGTMDFVEIKEDLISNEKARDFLRMLAKENRMRVDKTLLSCVKEGKEYLVCDLREMFEGWYNDKLKAAFFPQYKGVRMIKKGATKAAPKGDAYSELHEMVGLADAKAVIQKALNYYKMQRLYESKGIKRDTPAMHMVFSGNPGTAKTTVARLFARIMKENGLLPGGQLIEVGRGDLVGKYVGWTAQTVQAKFKAAVGGVLFIDEAYSLVDDRNGSFGDEAINAIVQEMENHRDDVVVILAGYPDKMESFMQKNPGLRSRVAFHVPFDDYDIDELCKIAALIGKSKGVSFDDEAMKKLRILFASARNQSDFGNGRYVRNAVEQARMNQASRLMEYDFDDITVAEITTIRAADIIVPTIKVEERRIGFAS